MEAAGQAQHSNWLSSMPLLAHMDEAGRARIARMLESVAFPQGSSVIIREGDLGETLFFVVEGEAFAEIKGEVVMRYEPGDYFGELSLLTGAPRKATVKAGPDGARCLLLTRDVFDTLDFNEEMWQERQRMYDAANAERIQHFFATSSSEEDSAEDDCSADDTDAPSEGVPPTSELLMLRDEVTQLRAANVKLQQQLSAARVEIERANARKQQETRETLLNSMEVVRDAQGALEDSSRAYTTSLQVQVEASAKEIAVLTTANAKLSEAVKGSLAGRSDKLSPNSTLGHVQQQAVVQECEAKIEKLRTRLATERQEYDSTVATLRQELAKRDLQAQDLEAALRDAHRQHAKRERLLRGAVDARTTAQHRLSSLNHDLVSSGHIAQVSSESPPYSYQHEDIVDESRTLTTANVATFGLDDTVSSTAELMELVDLVSKEF